jgi:hypothetical protein
MAAQPPDAKPVYAKTAWGHGHNPSPTTLPKGESTMAVCNFSHGPGSTGQLNTRAPSQRSPT